MRESRHRMRKDSVFYRIVGDKIGEKILLRLVSDSEEEIPSRHNLHYHNKHEVKRQRQLHI